jgi:hypothetical protein
MLSLSPPSFPFVHLMVAQRSVDRELAERARRENKEAACMLLTADVRLVAQWVWQRIHAQTWFYRSAQREHERSTSTRLQKMSGMSFLVKLHRNTMVLSHLV